MDQVLLKSLIPINALNPRSLNELVAQTRIESLPAGSKLFAQGQRDSQRVYLLAGEVALSSTDISSVHTVVGGTIPARYALAQLNPRQFTAIAKTPVTVVRIDSRLLDRLITWDQAASYEVAEIKDSQDAEWMMKLLRSEIFRKLPPANISSLFARFLPIKVKAGQIIIRQGDPGEYYYLIKMGSADVLRRSEKTHKVAIVDQIVEGEGFGEDALLTGAPRNATVVMVTDGRLMRLKRKDFTELLCEPLVKWLTLDEAKAKWQAGAGLLDVRVEDEFLSGSIKGSVNLPLYRLRTKFSELDRRRHYIVFCQSGSRSGAAAFLLSRQGFEVSVLRGGLDGLAPAAQIRPETARW
jgi:CRP-like cAMP-binding protein